MAQERLGLFDTPATGREIRFAGAAAGLLFVAFLFVVPFSSIRLRELDAFVPLTNSVIFVGELIIATMLYAQAAIFRSRALTVLASGFVFGSLLLVPHALTFPGAFAPQGLLEPGLNGTAWLMIFRRVGLPLAIIIYAGLEWTESKAPDARRPQQRVLLWVAAAIVLAAAATMASLRGGGLLPPMFVSRTEADYVNLTIFNVTDIVVIAIAMTLLVLKRTSVLDVWLLVALSSWALQLFLNLALHARFTLGWYSLFLVVVVSNMFMLLALIGESNRLYARLALSSAAQNRERDARMMTMEAVAAAISHEVGQPLAAVSLSASAALSSLGQNPPNTDGAIESLRDVLDAGYRSFDVLKSMRTTFSHGTGSLSQFNLNHLVREVVSLLSREFAARRITVELFLEEPQRPLLANRVQIQRVLMNLLTNAIESFAPRRRGSRRITVRSLAPDTDHLLLEISDNGTGIAPELTEHIFEPFFTTKPTGSGLGLSLSRTIAEDSGGRLWASPADGGGATFHFEMRCPRQPQQAEPPEG